MAASASVRESALCKHNHLLAVGRQWQHQQVDLHFASTITYILWEGNGSISKWICTLQAPSLTFCEKAMAGSASVRRSALCKHNHLHTVRRQWQDQHQQGVCTLQAQSLTRCGKAMARINISKSGSALCKHNHLLPVRRQWQISISREVCTLQAQSHTN